MTFGVFFQKARVGRRSGSILTPCPLLGLPPTVGVSSMCLWQAWLNPDVGLALRRVWTLDLSLSMTAMCARALPTAQFWILGSTICYSKVPRTCGVSQELWSEMRRLKGYKINDASNCYKKGCSQVGTFKRTGDGLVSSEAC